VVGARKLPPLNLERGHRGGKSDSDWKWRPAVSATHLPAGRKRRKTGGVALTGRREGAEAIRERIGPDAHYPTFVPQSVRVDASGPHQGWPWARLLWYACLLSLAIVLVLAVLVALGF
jgi:hypothetical protein